MGAFSLPTGAPRDRPFPFLPSHQQLSEVRADGTQHGGVCPAQLFPTIPAVECHVGELNAAFKQPLQVLREAGFLYSHRRKTCWGTTEENVKKKEASTGFEREDKKMHGRKRERRNEVSEAKEDDGQGICLCKEIEKKNDEVSKAVETDE